jgi:cytochrome P450
MTVTSEVLDSKLPNSEKETHRLRDESVILIIAGSESTARTLSTLVYHVLSDLEVLNALREELDQALPDATQSVELTRMERLPYLVRWPSVAREIINQADS